MGDLTKNFSRFEFTCRCGCGLDDIDMGLIQNLQKLRDLVGEALHVNSGCRCPAHNAVVGGEDHSFHLPENGCKAADIAARHLTPRELKDYALQIPAFKHGGIGLYPGFLHVDVRGYVSRWG